MDFLHSSPSRSMIHKAASGGGNGNLAKNISMLSSVLSLVEKLLPFWASSIISLPTFSVVLGILSYFSAGKLYSRFCSRFSKDAVQAITEAKDSNGILVTFDRNLTPRSSIPLQQAFCPIMWPLGNSHLFP